MLIKIPPKYSVSHIVGYLKGKSALHIAQRYAKRRQYRGYHFWSRGYFVSTVGLDEEVVKAYIREQEKEEEHYGEPLQKTSSSGYLLHDSTGTRWVTWLNDLTRVRADLAYVYCFCSHHCGFRIDDCGLFTGFNPNFAIRIMPHSFGVINRDLAGVVTKIL